MEQECRKRDVAEKEEIDRVIIFVDSDSDVSDNEGIATASEGDKSTDTADETTLFLNANLKLWNEVCCNELTEIWKLWNKRMHK